METPAAPASAQMFVRRSSGLVRDISGHDALIGSLVCFNLAIAAITLVSLPFAFPGANLPVSVLLALIPAALLGGVYVLFGIAMPRSGGDYIYISRALHPSIGLAANMSATAWNLIILGVYANWTSTVGLSGLFASLGLTTHSTTWNDWAAKVASKGWAFGIGTIVIALITLILLNVRLALRIQKVLFYLGMLGIGVAVAVVAFTSHATFVAHVNKITSYDKLMGAAAKAGYAAPAGGWSDAKQTILGTALLCLSTLFVMYAVYTGGEVRNVRKSIPYSIFGTVIVGGTVFFLMAVVAVRTWSHGFLSAAWTLYYNDPTNYPFAAAPQFNFLASIANSNQIVVILINLAFVFIPMASMVFTAIAATRCLFAWSFDRLLPAKVASVNDRTHSPVVATLIAAVAAEAALYFYTYFGSVAFLGGATMGWISAFATTCLAAVVYPFLRRAAFNATPEPVRRMVAGVPLLAVTGVVAFAVLAVMIYAFLTNATFGANTRTDLLFFGGFWVIGFAMYWIVRAIRISQGVPFDAALAELPPE
jgi:basic amino acid/polyamine antiporter, APA family